jgi:predicted nuclease of predicted toxin-antitoxin system
MMRIKVDEDLPNLAAQWLRDKGYDAATVREQEMGGWKDFDLWESVQSERRFLVTADKGFGDIRAYPPGAHGGILLLRPAEDGIRPILELLHLALDRIDLSELQGSVTVVTPRGLRIRRR